MTSDKAMAKAATRSQSLIMINRRLREAATLLGDLNRDSPDKLSVVIRNEEFLLQVRMGPNRTPDLLSCSLYYAADIVKDSRGRIIRSR